jgi:hypothetical protein
MLLTDLFRWGYQHSREIGHITNVIQVQCGNRKQKMMGLFNLVSRGSEVRSANFDLFGIRIDGAAAGIAELEKYAK